MSMGLIIDMWREGFFGETEESVTHEVPVPQ